MPYKDPSDRAASQRRYQQSQRGKATRTDYLKSYGGKEAAKSATNKWRRSRITPHKGRMRTAPFVGCDGEGGGVDADGRQNYLLLRAGDSVLFNDNQRLTTKDCLDFLTALDPSPIYVGFFFDYDTTQILRDIPAFKLRELLARRVPGDGKTDTILWEDFEIGYFPRKHLKVRKIGGTWITVHDVGTFFQCSFVKVLNDWQIGTEEERASIAADKERREVFVTMTARELSYNALECRLLAEIMEQFRQVCLDTMAAPKVWEGPGHLAAAMMRDHGVPRSKEIVQKVIPNGPGVPKELWHFANDAYYGGRFEVFKIGHVKGVVEHDICSAYPSAYRALPCLLHGTWSRTIGEPSGGGLYVADVHFIHDDESPIVCNLPVRTKTGSLIWPREGNGRYWSIELDEARKAGTVVKEWREVWSYAKNCDCDTFREWVSAVYQQRQAIGKSVRGYPIKLGLNSVYGKCCQSIGHPPYANPVFGGLITAVTRAQLITAYASIDPRRLVMLATDGVYTVGRLDSLREGAELGDWEVGPANDWPQDIFIIKPGMYAWERAGKVKTRGVPKKVFEQNFPAMQQRFDDWIKLYRSWPEDLVPYWPEMTFEQQLFIGTRLGLQLKPPNYAGMWIKRQATHSFDPTIKRRPSEPDPVQDHFNTYAHLGSPSLKTVYYNKAIGAQVTDEIGQEMRDVITASPFQSQTEAEDWGLLISGLDADQLFDDDTDLSIEDIN
jgi:hypothetical protein